MLSVIGLIHSYVITDDGIEGLLIGQNGTWVAAPAFAAIYAACAAAMLLLAFTQYKFGVCQIVEPKLDNYGYWITEPVSSHFELHEISEELQIPEEK